MLALAQWQNWLASSASCFGSSLACSLCQVFRDHEDGHRLCHDGSAVVFTHIAPAGEDLEHDELCLLHQEICQMVDVELAEPLC